MQIYFNGREVTNSGIQVSMADGPISPGKPIAISNYSAHVIEKGASYDVRVELFHPDVSDMAFECHLSTLEDGRLLAAIPVNLRFQEPGGHEWYVVTKDNRFGLRCGYLEHFLYVINMPNGISVSMGDNLLDFFGREPLPGLLWEARRVLRDKLQYWGKLASLTPVTPKPPRSQKPNRFSLVE